MRASGISRAQAVMYRPGRRGRGGTGPSGCLICQSSHLESKREHTVIYDIPRLGSDVSVRSSRARRGGGIGSSGYLMYQPSY